MLKAQDQKGGKLVRFVNGIDIKGEPCTDVFKLSFRSKVGLSYRRMELHKDGRARYVYYDDEFAPTLIKRDIKELELV